MRRLYILITCILVYQASAAQVLVKNLLVEDSKDPICVDETTPRLSWQLDEMKGLPVTQQAYEIQVDSVNDVGGHRGRIWASGKVMSDQSLYIPYKGTLLKSGMHCVWKVRVWDASGKASAWSQPAFWSMGLLSPLDWRAKWISTPELNRFNEPAPLLRTEFTVKKQIKSAIAYITAHGFYEAKVNGQKIGHDYLTPGWTSYNKRLQYQSYDVRDLIKPGRNAIGVSLGSGWFRSPLGPVNPRPNNYGKDVALLMQIKVVYSDNSVDWITSGNNWRTSTGALRSAEIYNGCVYDYRKEQAGWLDAGFNDSKWDQASVRGNLSKENLIATYNEPVREHETFKAVKLITTPKGEKILDFGQNLVGWVRATVKGQAGDSVKISHAEVLDKAGNFYTENLRAAKAQDVYVLKDDEQKTYEPKFTWQGFRYIKIQGVRGEINPDDFTAVTIYSDMKPSGTFKCSDTMLNKLQHNIQWGQKGNFLDVPTDCPQRDERLGWTGDAQVFSRTAAFNMDVHNFFFKWMKDMAADQYPSGSIPYVIPDVFTDGKSELGGSTGWADAVTIIPWTLYNVYGDEKFLSNQYESMKAWVNYIQKQTHNNLWTTGDHFGDWLFYSVNNDAAGSSAITNKYLIAQCFYAHSTQILINSAHVLGKTDDEKYYTDLLVKIKKAFQNEYVTPNGLVSSDTQTAYTLALEFDMLPTDLRKQAAERLNSNVAKYDDHLTTGFLGTPYLCDALTEYGYQNMAYRLLLQDTYPSWLYPVKEGATTIWERWDGIRPDGTFEDASMNSYNHYAYGAIGDWMYSNITGIQPGAPGYKKIIIKPIMGGKLTWADATYECPYGKISVDWAIEAGKLTMRVTVPQNTTADIYVPDAAGKSYETHSVQAGNYTYVR